MRKLLETRMTAELEPDGDAVKVVADLRSKEGEFLNHLKLNYRICICTNTGIHKKICNIF